jgi:flagellar biosynthesis/type III secretory pathway protein FliH
MLATPWALDELPTPDIFTMSDAVTRDVESMDNVDMQARFAVERTRLEADAYARGVQDAERAGGAAGEAHIASALAALNNAIASVQLHATRWTANAEENVAALAIVVARHIVLREVTTDPAIVRDLVQRALAQFPIDQTITVRLHPDDAATCTAASLMDGSIRTPEVRCVADPHIARGGCLLEGRERIIDGRVDTSLERAYRSIGQIRPSGRTSRPRSSRCSIVSMSPTGSPRMVASRAWSDWCSKPPASKSVSVRCAASRAITVIVPSSRKSWAFMSAACC